MDEGKVPTCNPDDDVELIMNRMVDEKLWYHVSFGNWVVENEYFLLY